MLTIVIPEQSRWDEISETFIDTEAITIDLEHSLLSMSEWEAKYKKPFMDDEHHPKTTMEWFDYIYMMRLDRSLTPDKFINITAQNVEEIKAYINDKRTATTFTKEQLGKPSREIVTSELIYAWLVLQNIPFEVEKWHVSRILTLVNVVSLKNQPPKKQSPVEAMNRARATKRSIRASKPHIPKH